ncbi:MAG: alpha/beta hydrolase [Rhodospirillaceae bacterium]|nr:alpha/beta hydrolase [Rhodospirillaceae bacterium]
MFTPFTAGDGETIPVQITGNGPPIVLLHEWAGDSHLWTPLAERLAHHFTVHAWDARGHGGHPSTGSEPPTLQRMADDLMDLIDRFALVRPLVVGHSMGALTLWAHVLRHGCRHLGRICILDQSPKLVTDDGWPFGIYGGFTVADNARLVARMRADFPEGVLHLVGHGKNPKARDAYERNSRGMQRLRERLAALAPEPLIACWQSLTAADLRPALPRITVPTLLIYGEASNYYGPEVGAHVQSQIAGSRLLVYEHSDHAPHLNRPEHFLEDLAAFAAAPDKAAA